MMVLTWKFLCMCNVGKMCVSTQSKFYTVISNIMANYKRLPSGRDYERVGQEVVRKYPFMKNSVSEKVNNTVIYLHAA